MAPTTQYAAFFDVDGTLVTSRTLISFLEFVSARLGWRQEPWYRAHQAELGRMVRAGAPRERLNEFFYTAFRGFSVERAMALGEEWFGEVSALRGFLHEPGVLALEAHRSAAAKIVFVTGSFLPVLRPLQRLLKADDVLASEVAVRDGVYQGTLVCGPCIGAGKAHAVGDYLVRTGIDAERCHAYGDDESDRPMLDAVGFGHWVEPPASYRGELVNRDW